MEFLTKYVNRKTHGQLLYEAYMILSRETAVWRELSDKERAKWERIAAAASEVKK